MSTDPTAPGTPEPTPAADAVQPAAPSTAGPSAASADQLGSYPAPTAGGASTATVTGSPAPLADGPAPTGDAEPGFVTRHTSTLIGVMVGVIVAALAIIGVGLYRHHLDSRDSDTEDAFRTTVSAQGATLETVECHGDTCAAVINGQAYTVLVQEDDKGKQHFGVSAYTGN